MDDVKQRNRLEDKIDKIGEHISSIDITLAKQSMSLDEHIKRSNMLEAKMAPLERHVTAVHGVLSFLGLLGVLAGLVEFYIQLKK